MIVHKSNIPQNRHSFLFFQKNDYYKSVEILFNYFENINLCNLYLSLKHYLSREYYFIKYIFIVAHISLDEGSQKIIPRFHNINLIKLKKMNFFDFKEWFNELLDNDWKYMQSYHFYGFNLIFYDQSVLFQEKEFWPQYPWNPFFKKMFISYDNTTNNNKTKIQIKKLKQQISLLLKYVSRRKKYILKK